MGYPDLYNHLLGKYHFPRIQQRYDKLVEVHWLGPKADNRTPV